jgi:transcriptional regulator with XRE-family HTH domain
MSDLTVSQRLSQARRARREDLAALARRIGVRLEHLRAIEQGRLADLPPGIYGRAAIRAFAMACGFDPAETLAECESELTPVEEPISALGRLRGVRQPPPRPRAVATPSPAATTQNGSGSASGDWLFPNWRLPAAAALDACVVAGLLLVVVICAITAMMVSVSVLDHSGPAFGLMGVLLGSAYFVWFGGLGGRTMGDQVLGVEPRNMEHGSLTLRAIGARALLAATEDARFIRGLGVWAGITVRQRFSVRSAPQPGPLRPGASGGWPRMIGTTGGHEIRQKAKKRSCRIDRLIDDDPQDAAVTRTAVVTAFRQVERVVRAVPQR